MNPLLWLWIALISAGIWLLRRLYSALAEHLRVARLVNAVPGPPTLPLIGNAHQFSADNEKATYQMECFFRTYTEEESSPGLMRIWLGPKPVLIVYKAETAKAILDSQCHIAKPFAYGILEEWLGTGLLTSTGEKWYRRRKALTPTFHFSILGNYVHVFNRQSNVLIEKLDERAADGYPFDFYKYIKAFALDVICEASMGVNIDSQRGRNLDYAQAVRRMCELSWVRMRAPWFWPELTWRLLGQGRDYNQALAVVKRFTKRVIAERKAEYLGARQSNSNGSSAPKKLNGEDSSASGAKAAEKLEGGGSKKRLAFLDMLIEMQTTALSAAAEGESRGKKVTDLTNSTENNNNANYNVLTDEDIREEVDTFMFEGHDTVSSSMGFFVFMVGMRPDYQERLYAELLEIFGECPHQTNGSALQERDVTVEDVARMHFLDACVRETLRLLPTVPIIGRVLAEEAHIAGYTLPAGLTVMLTPFAIQRDRRYYARPDEFDPDAHFGAEEVRRRARQQPFAYIPFSAGPRNCIGQKFATLEQRITLAKLLRRYRIVTAVHELENRGLPELILKPSKGVVVRLERRNAGCDICAGHGTTGGISPAEGGSRDSDGGRGKA